MLFSIAATLLVGACDRAKDANRALDPVLQERIKTVKDCFPALQQKADVLLELANSWRMNTSQPIPDPQGLTWSEVTGGSVNVTYVTADGTIHAVLKFYNHLGEVQDLNLNAADPLSKAIKDAATQLSTQSPGTKPFIVASWTLSGPVATGSGNLTGIIGGTTNQNELEELRTTDELPSNGPPPVADSQITITASACVLTFRTSGLKTDTGIDQKYPIGTVSITIVGQQTVIATVTFNDTAIANIVVSEVPGSFDYNLDTGDLQYNP
ncbi:MAG: hypothetical protein ACE5F1_15185 [Planctomycetota bacterium]